MDRLKEFPEGEWITTASTYTNAKHDLELYYCLRPHGEKSIHQGMEYSNFEYEKSIHIDYSNSSKMKSIIKNIKIKTRPPGWTAGNTQPRYYKIHSWDNYMPEVLHGLIHYIFTKEVEYEN